MSQTIIDDQDFSHINYNGSWLRGGGALDHDGTLMSSTRVNDFFTVSFTGNLITVYGQIDATSGGVLTNYSIDGAPPAQTTSQAGAGDTPNQQFWKSPFLNVGDHNLVVTMVKVNPSTPGEGTIWFDYFLVNDPRIQANSATKSKNIGAIVGGVIGGVLALTFILLAIIFLRRRHKRRLNHIQPWTDKEVESDVSSTSSHPNIEPFPRGVEENNANPATTLTSTTPRKVASQRTTTHQPSLSTASSSTSPSSISGPPSNNVVVTSNTPRRKRQGAGGSSAPTSGDLTVQPSSTSLPEAVQHVDSGVRVAGTDPVQTPSAPLELPPVYSPV